MDGVAQRLGAGLIGYVERTASFAELRSSSQLYLVKTHRQRDAGMQDDDREICLVRDGQDAPVSWARQASDVDPGGYDTRLHDMITHRDVVGTGSWVITC